MLSNEDKIFLNNIVSEYDKLCERLEYPEVFLDKKLYLFLDKQKRELEPIALEFKKYTKLKEDVGLLKELGEDSGNLQEYKSRLESSESVLKSKIENMNAVIDNILVEIVSLNGDDMARVFGNMIENVARLHNWQLAYCTNGNVIKYEIVGLNARKIVGRVCGLHVSSTGKCQVFIFNNAKVDDIRDSDITIETYRSSGAGGQHINTTDSAIRAIHRPTNISVICQNERSQIQNREKAIENLKERVNKYFENKIEDEKIKTRKVQLKNMKTPLCVFDFDLSTLKMGKEVIRIEDFESGEF